MKNIFDEAEPFVKAVLYMFFAFFFLSGLVTGSLLTIAVLKWWGVL